MLHESFRPHGADQQRTVVQFCALAFGPGYRQQMVLFDQMRRKRNRLIYETVGLVARQEVEQALAFAGRFVEDIRLRVSGQPRLGLEEPAQPPEV